MPDMYDKLGEMLNEALESGKIPTEQNNEADLLENCDADQLRHCEADTLRHCEAEGRSKPENQNDQITSNEKTEESGHFSFNKSEKAAVNNKESAKKSKNRSNSDSFRHCEAESRSNPTGEVIKLHKYTYNMQFPPDIQKALSTLDIVYPFTQKDIKNQYHKLLKENHPDSKNTIQDSKDVQNIRHKSIDDITTAYKILSDFFGF